MEKARRLRATAELGEAPRSFDFKAARRAAAAGIFGAIGWMTPTGASAQLDELLRNVLQNAIQVPQPAYRPGYSGQSGARAPLIPDAGMVAELQRMLDDLGYDAGPADGAFGSRTVQALSSFERDHGQPPSTELSAAALAAVRSVWYDHNRGAAPSSAGVNPAVPRPSFDCARAVAPSARTICGSAPLAQLDAEMAAAYVAAKAGAPAQQQAKVEAEQHEWLRRRNGCGADASCLERSLTARRDQLRMSAGAAGMTWSGAAPMGPDAPAAAPAPNPAPATVAADQTGAAAAAIVALSQPQAGLRALKFPMLEGRPVFGLDWHLSGDGASFFKLVALGGSPNLIESDDGADNGRQFASDLLKRPNKYLSQSGDWAGENEFQRAASRQAFLEDYGERLRQMAPKPPFEFVYAPGLTIAGYDAKLGGFPLNGAPPNLTSLPFGWLQPSPDFKWPDLFLPIDKAEAQRLLDRLAAARTTRMGDPRAVRLAAVIEAARLDPGSRELQLSLRRLALYNDDLTQSLYEFPVPTASPHPTADILSRLLAPPPGMMPITLPTIEGRPLLRPDVVSENFLALAALGQLPDLLKERRGIDIRTISGLELSLVRNFLTPDAQLQLTEGCATAAPIPSDLRRCVGDWKGADEFARERARQNFEQNYLPRLKELAPKGPFEFACAPIVTLPEYDAKRGGFALGKIGIDDGRWDNCKIADTMGAQWTRQFEPPDLFLPLDAPSAERLLHQLEQAAARQQVLSHSINDRGVRVVLIIEASRIEPDPNRMALRLKAVQLYTEDLKTKLYTFPGIGPEPEPYLTSAIPAKLEVPSPAPLDTILLDFKYIEALGDKTPDAVYAALWQLIATRDEAFYRQPDRWAGLTPNDGRRPFFPRGGAERTQPAIAAFRDWAKAYAAGLPATAAFSMLGMSSEQRNGSYTFEAILGGRVAPVENYAKFLSDSHLQADQLVSIDNADFPIINIGGAAVPVLFALPNRWSLYTFKIPKQTVERHPGANPVSVSTFKLGAGRLAGDDRGRPVLVIDLAPLSTRVSFGNDTVGTGTYDDIPPLNGLAFTSPSPQPEKPVNGSAFALDSTLLDLLAAKAVGEKLSPQALSYMIERRWLAETKSAAPGGRFFVLGKRQPTPEEAAALAPSFIDWARQHAPGFPMKATVTANVEIANNQKTAPWHAIPCLAMSESSFDRLRDASSDVFDLSRQKAAAAGGNVSWSQQDEERLAAAEVFSSLSQSFYLGGGPSGVCGSAPLNFSFSNPAFFAIRIAHALPTPILSALAGEQQLELAATLDLESVAFSQHPPSLADLLPPELRKMAPQSPSSAPTGEFITFDTTFVEARWHDANGKEVRLGSEYGDDLDGLVKRYRQTLAKLAAKEATPSGPYGFDLVGVRLGMSFEDAESAIRSHMKVGRVVEGRRAFDTKEQSGFIKPLDSGKLFISESGDELFAILDEPPAATGRVMAAWRRISIPAGTEDPAEILAGIKKKYGPPSGPPMWPGTILSWRPSATGNLCSGVYQDGQAYPLTDAWFENGHPMARDPSNTLRVQLEAALMPRPLFDPLAEQNQQWRQCGPSMTAVLWTGQSMQQPRDQLDMTLSDIGPYLKAYAESRATLQGTRPGDSSNATAQQPGTAGGIKF